MNAKALNGHDPGPTPPPEPAPLVARWVYDANLDEGDLSFDGLPEEDRALLINFARDYIGSHVRFCTENGIRLVGPGMVLRPKSDEEAAMMTEAVRLYSEAKGRKGKLLTGERKLILPPGVH